MQSLYKPIEITRIIDLHINNVGKNIEEQTFLEYIATNFEGRCIEEGYIKKHSSSIVSYSCGKIIKGSYVRFHVVFKCEACYLVEGMVISCKIEGEVTAGFRARSATESPSPFVVSIPKDHHFMNERFVSLQKGDIINVVILGARYELNEPYINAIGILEEK